MIHTENAKTSNRNTYIGFIFLFVVCIGFMFAEIINNRFWLSDFEVYYKAAQRLLASENLYQHAEDGHYQFKYSPTSAILFIPFSFFSFAVAKYIYWLLLTGLILFCFYLCISHIHPLLFPMHDKKTINKIVFSASFILAVHFLRELHLGQVNYLLLFTYVFATHCLVQNKWKLFSVLLGISIFIKPFALIFLPYLLLRKKYNELIVFILTALLCAILPVLFYHSIDMTVDQYRLWFIELQIELSHKQGLLADANHTIFSVVARHTLIRYLLINSRISVIYQLCLLALIAFFVFHFIKCSSAKTNKLLDDQYTFIDISLLVALIPLLAFTSENAFIYTQILVFAVLLYFKKLRIVERIVGIIGFLFIGGNFAELIGKKLSVLADNISLVTIGTMILIYLLFRLKKRGALGVESEDLITPLP